MQDQQIAQPIPITITFNDANGVRPDRPNGGCYITQNPQTSSALTCADNDTKVMQPIAYVLAGEHPQKGISEEIAPTLPAAMGMGGGHTPLVTQPIAVDTYNQTINEHSTQTIRAASSVEHIGAVLQTMAIRRLTPKECERLQGFPDDWTKIPYRNKPADQCPDGPRYKACGNSMAVPVMRWIGERIKLIESML